MRVSAEEYSMPYPGWNPQRACGRADPEIACDTAHAIRANAAVPEEWVEILVNQGFVTLAGTVEWDYQRNLAEFCVRNVAGVRGVINLI
jgi:osmotically-inducible protein OsmY